MATSVDAKLARLPGDRRAPIETRAAALIAEEPAERESRTIGVSPSRAPGRQP